MASEASVNRSRADTVFQYQAFNPEGNVVRGAKQLPFPPAFLHQQDYAIVNLFKVVNRSIGKSLRLYPLTTEERNQLLAGNNESVKNGLLVVERTVPGNPDNILCMATQVAVQAEKVNDIYLFFSGACAPIKREQLAILPLDAKEYPAMVTSEKIRRYCQVDMGPVDEFARLKAQSQEEGKRGQRVLKVAVVGENDHKASALFRQNVASGALPGNMEPERKADFADIPAQVVRTPAPQPIREADAKQQSELTPNPIPPKDPYFETIINTCQSMLSNAKSSEEVAAIKNLLDIMLMRTMDKEKAKRLLIANDTMCTLFGLFITTMQSRRNTFFLQNVEYFSYFTKKINLRRDLPLTFETPIFPWIPLEIHNFITLAICPRPLQEQLFEVPSQMTYVFPGEKEPCVLLKTINKNQRSFDAIESITKNNRLGIVSGSFNNNGSPVLLILLPQYIVKKIPKNATKLAIQTLDGIIKISTDFIIRGDDGGCKERAFKILMEFAGNSQEKLDRTITTYKDIVEIRPIKSEKEPVNQDLQLAKTEKDVLKEITMVLRERGIDKRNVGEATILEQIEDNNRYLFAAEMTKKIA